MKFGNDTKPITLLAKVLALRYMCLVFDNPGAPLLGVFRPATAQFVYVYGIDPLSSTTFNILFAQITRRKVRIASLDVSKST